MLGADTTDLSHMVHSPALNTRRGLYSEEQQWNDKQTGGTSDAQTRGPRAERQTGATCFLPSRPFGWSINQRVACHFTPRGVTRQLFCAESAWFLPPTVRVRFMGTLHRPQVCDWVRVSVSGLLPVQAVARLLPGVSWDRPSEGERYRRWLTS